MTMMTERSARRMTRKFFGKGSPAEVAGPLDEDRQRALREKADRERQMVREMRVAEAGRAREIREWFVATYARMAWKIARRCAGGDDSLAEDMFQEAIRGLLLALDGYDPEHETSFCTYAACGMIRLPLAYRARFRHAVTVPRGQGRAYDDCYQAVLRTVSINDPAVGTPIPDPDSDRACRCVDEAEMVKFLMAPLEPRDRHLVECAFGLNGKEETSGADIARSLGLTRSRVAQILAGRALPLMLARANGMLSDDGLAGGLGPARPLQVRGTRKKKGPPAGVPGPARLPAMIKDDATFALMLAGCNERQAEVLRLRKEGYRVREIADRLGRGHESVRQILKWVKKRAAVAIA